MSFYTTYCLNKNGHNDPDTCYPDEILIAEMHKLELDENKKNNLAFHISENMLYKSRILIILSMLLGVLLGGLFGFILGISQVFTNGCL